MSFPESTLERPEAICRSGAATALAAELLSGSSLEVGAHRPQDAQAIAALLPAGTPVYINHLPRHRLLDTLPTLVAVRAAGLEPVPHIAARHILGRAELQNYLAHAVGDAGVRKALVLGGDLAVAAGPYADAAALLREGDLARAGLREIGFAGYPEGHPRIPSAVLERALADKLALATAQGLGSYVLTQFTFTPARVIEYCAALARKAPGVAVYVGLAGPTDPITLFRFARRCGVSATLRALRAQGLDAVRYVMHIDPVEQLAAVAHHAAGRSDSNVVGIHLFTFGGVTAAANWINRHLRTA